MGPSHRDNAPCSMLHARRSILVLTHRPHETSQCLFRLDGLVDRLRRKKLETENVAKKKKMWIHVLQVSTEAKTH